MRRSIFLLVVLLLVLDRTRAAEPFEIYDGDRVVLLGDALLERENTYGYLETRMHEQFPDRTFTVRNISWAGDTPRGWSRASFDPAEKGLDRLREAIELTRPTVVFLGYGMAASLQEMTDRAQDPTLNPDPARYGREPMSAARFKRELGELMDLIVKVRNAERGVRSGEPGGAAASQPGGLKEISRGSSEAKTPGTPPANAVRPEGAPEPPASSAPAGAGAVADPKPRVSPGANVPQPAGLPGAPAEQAQIAREIAGSSDTPHSAPRTPHSSVRFVLLSPIRHEDLRAVRPGLPDPAPHNVLLEQYSKAIEELAQERGARFVTSDHRPLGWGDPNAPHVVALTENGIHPSAIGFDEISRRIAWSLNWRTGVATPITDHQSPITESSPLRAAVLRKNAVFFHRFRPANLTYLTGFRKHEQGQNAKEIPEFDALVTTADAEIDRLKRAPKSAAATFPDRFEVITTTDPRADQNSPAAKSGQNEPGPVAARVNEEKSGALDAKEVPENPAIRTSGGNSGPGNSNSRAPGGNSGPGNSNPRAPGGNSGPGNSNSRAPGGNSGPGISNSRTPGGNSGPGISNSRTPGGNFGPGISSSRAPGGNHRPEISMPSPMSERNSAHLAPSGAPRAGGFMRIAAVADAAPAGSRPSPAPAGTPTPVPLPDFTVLDGYQIELWAENPHLEKPTQMNWDAQGRLWVASSNTYPQVDPQDVALAMARQAGVRSAEFGMRSGENSSAADNSAPRTPHSAPPPLSAGNDKIIILEDTDRDGRADKSTIFADGLLIPTGVAPDLAFSMEHLAFGKNAAAPAGSETPVREAPNPQMLNVKSKILNAAYVAQSTELLHLRDTDGDGRADQRRVVFSGFGTEDTHHLIHTLRWGPDGRLYFAQSVYIHSHLETPWGMVRLNAGGVFAYDPRTERVEVFCKGLWNSWGHAWDDWGQSFLTDGAGRDGISWAFPGAVFAPSEGARKTTVSVSPGSYPKFCGLEIVKSPHFPADWQGNAVTCDFRAHRIVRFAIDDLAAEEGTAKQQRSEGKTGVAAPGASPSSPSLLSSLAVKKSGFVTRELPDLVRTSDASFRPIDVRLGPDGALYLADWSNPVINHGEVDFRDPRRDKERGRIWRITKKGAEPVKWEPLVGKKNEALLDALLSKSAWEKEQARRCIDDESPAGRKLLTDRAVHDITSKTAASSTRELAFVLAKAGIGGWESGLYLMSKDDRVRALAIRVHGRSISKKSRVSDPGATQPKRPWPVAEDAIIARSVSDSSPRVRLETMRAVALVPDAKGADLIFTAARNAPKDDPHYEFAAWQSINDLAKPWTDAIASGAWKADTAEREAQLAWGLKAIDPALAGATLAKLVAEKKIPLDGTGPWFELIGAAGGAAELQPLWDSLLVSFAGNCCETDETRDLEGKVAFFDKADTGARAMRAVLEAARTRNLRPAARTHLAGVLFHVDHLRLGAIELAGMWKTPEATGKLTELLGGADANVTPELRRTIFRALRAHGSGEARVLIEAWTAADAPLEGRREAVLALAALDFAKAAPLLPGVLAKFPDENAALPYWRELLAMKGAPDEFAKLFATDGWKDVTKPVRAAREAGKPAAKLLAALGTATAAAPRNYKDYANSARTDGDPVKGEMIYRRANLACVTCHAIGGAGGKVGPDMTSIGASAPVDYIIESIFAPAVKVKEGYNAVSVTMLDGLVVSGVQVRETAAELVVRDAIGKEQSIPKGQIKAKTDIGSIMPAGLVEQLPHREQMDLFHFLGELGKPGPYDASKGSVARLWRLYPGDASPAPDVAANPGFPGYTLVDGRFTKELLAEAAQFAAAGKDTVLAVAQFQSGGKTRLKLTGATKAWLDGQPLALTNGEATPDLANGTHTLTVQLDTKTLPEVLRAESPDARFLGN